MANINLSKTDLSAGSRRALATFKKADTNRTGLINPSEVKKFRGAGAAQLKSVFAYAQHIEGAGSPASLVPLKTVEKALRNLSSGLATVARTKGDKDGRIDGNEIKYASKAGAALARFAHATK